jgi:hypothetical protein
MTLATEQTRFEDEEANAMRQLWCSVVNVLLADARCNNVDGWRARAWCRDPDDLVLWCAGLNPEAARPILRTLADDVIAALLAGYDAFKTISELAEATGLPRATVTAEMRRLAAEGRLTRSLTDGPIIERWALRR